MPLGSILSGQDDVKTPIRWPIFYNALATRGLMDKEPDVPPPIFGTWGRFYAVVIANTLLTYLLLVLFSAYAR